MHGFASGGFEKGTSKINKTPISLFDFEPIHEILCYTQYRGMSPQYIGNVTSYTTKGKLGFRQVKQEPVALEMVLYVNSHPVSRACSLTPQMFHMLSKLFKSSEI